MAAAPVTNNDIEEHADYVYAKDFVDGLIPVMYRLAGDYRANFGDGGAAHLVYPVWIAPQLTDVDPDLRSRLLLLLRKLGNARKDFHVGSPVKDIIDPDLCPRLMKDEANYVLNRIAEYKLRMTRGASDHELCQSLPPDLRNGQLEPDESLKLREQYQWIPSNFEVKLNGEVEILTPINGILDRVKYKEFYDIIAHIFAKMVPLFAKLHLINEDKSTTLQVIVKAQEYDLNPGMTYAGRWHMEGQTEKIVAAGVYYLDVGDLQGGNLKFRPALAPQDWYGIQTSHETSVSTGTAIVFSNTIPHRFRKMRNMSNSNANERRTFLNFFIVDPTCPIPLPSSFTFSDFIRLCLNRYTKETLSERLPPLITRKILFYVPNLWANLKEAKLFRQKAREAMLRNKSGWGWINWGNCGTTEFVTSWSTFPDRKKSECYDLKHTESE